MTTATKTLTRRKYTRLFSYRKGRGHGSNDDATTWSSEPAPKQELLSFEQAQPYEQDNPFILFGYRPQTQSYAGSLATLFAIHNQTVNIWSHLIGSILYGISGLYFFWHHASLYASTFSTGDAIAFSCFFAAVVVCLSLSVGFHLFANHSKEIHDRHLFLDFLGILGLIWGSWVPGIYYGFYCQRDVARFYWALIGAITSACTLMLILPHLRTPTYKPLRTTLFIALGLSGILPMASAARTYSIPHAAARMGWWFFVLEGVFYVTGVALYATKFPERCWPGRFDFVGASHQGFHVFVLFGAGAHLAGVLRAFAFNHAPETRVCAGFGGVAGEFVAAAAAAAAGTVA
ncbi:hypothetical protein AAFC00_004533 [Neodothiora populina]|uniref:Uncharacterized protein n=1 Tax=Neodothiora populina TaxID=2781224 RepID=A0ABR3P2B5_9PEZI